MSEPKRGCLTCRWADYLKTPTGRLVRDTAIRCNFPMPSQQEYFDAVQRLLPASVSLSVDKLCKHWMWPGEPPRDGSECQKWEPTP